MAGVPGKITRAKGGERTTVYLSDAFGVWMEGENLKLTNQKKANNEPNEPIMSQIDIQII